MFINQLRMKIGVMQGSPETTSGGMALKFYASVRLEVRKFQTLRKGDQPYGSLTRFKVVKNKVAPPFKMAILEVIYGEGISIEGELIDLGIKYKLVEKAGSWFSCGEVRIGQGKEKAKAYLRENPEIRKELSDKINSLMKGDTDDDIVKAESDESLIVEPGDLTNE